MTIRTRTRVLVVAELCSIVVVSSDTPDTNTANNTAQANVTTFSHANVQAQITAPPTGRVAAPLSYRVFATLGRNSQATALRLCTRPPATFVQVKAAGTFKYRGVYCRDYGHVLPSRSVSFLLSASPSATGRLTPDARATAVGAPRASRVSAVIVVAGALACPAAKRPTAHAAC